MIEPSRTSLFVAIALALAIGAPGSALPLSPFANHSGEDHSADSHSGYLEGIDLSFADLSNSDFSLVNLTSADLTSADVSNTILTSANLTGAIFVGVDLSQSDLSGSTVSGADFSGADVSVVDWTGVLYNGATIFPSGFDPVANGLVFVPNPDTGVLLATGLVGLAVYGRRRSSHPAAAASKPCAALLDLDARHGADPCFQGTRRSLSMTPMEHYGTG